MMALAKPAPVEALPAAPPATGYTLSFAQKSKSSEELSRETAVPEIMAASLSSVTESEPSNPRSSTASDSSSSCCGMSLLERSDMAVEELKASRKQLEDEIEVRKEEDWGTWGLQVWSSRI